MLHIIHVEPVDILIDRQMSQTRPQIIATLTTIWRRTEPVALSPDISDGAFAMIQRRLDA